MKKIILLITFLSLGLLMVTQVVLAQGAKDAVGALGQVYEGEDRGDVIGLAKTLEEPVGGIISVVLYLSGGIFLILTVYAGVIWMTAYGNEERVEKAKRIITATIIGFIIVVFAYAITYAITSRVGNAGRGAQTGAGWCAYVDANDNLQTCAQISETECNKLQGTLYNTKTECAEKIGAY